MTGQRPPGIVTVGGHWHPACCRLGLSLRVTGAQVSLAAGTGAHASPLCE